MKFLRKDLYFSIITGFIAGFIAWQVFDFLNVRLWIFGHFVCPSGFLCTQVIRNEISWAWLMLIVPVLWIFGVNLGYFLGRWFKFFNQFGKFAAVGFTNAAVYFGILNILIYYSDINKGLWYSVFVTMAFIIATFHS